MAQTIQLILDETIHKTFLASVKARGNKIAIREKELGIWQPTTWNGWYEKSRAIAFAIKNSGLQEGDVVSILANTIADWCYADMGVLLAGNVCSGIYPTDSPSQVQYLVDDSKTRLIFVEDDEQLDKILNVRGRCPTLTRIVVFDMDGLQQFSDPMVISLDDFIKEGKAIQEKLGKDAADAQFKAMVESRRPDDLSLLVYTSGTTGAPKGAMHAHKSVMYQVQNANKLYHIGEQEERLCFLPLCHITERVGGYYTGLATGAIMNFAESPETVIDNIREVQPTAFFAVPRVWEKFYSSVTLAVKDGTPMEKWAYKTAIGIGYKIAEHRLNGTTPPAALKAAHKVADQLVLRNIKRMIGIDRCHTALTGAAPISPDLIRWYLGLGLNLYEAYGQTENCGFATAMPPDRIKLGTIGKSVPWGNLKISDQGEILLKGDYLMMGYLNHPQKTAETIDADGWLHTGDVGMVDEDGFVKITDRMKDIIITAGGKNITPSEIENQLKFSPYINDAVVVGDKRPYLTCLIMIDQENVEKFAQDLNIPFTNYASLCRAREVRDLIWSEIEKVNANFARVETIKKFYLIDQQLTAEDEELTPTLKLKRSFVNKKYAAEIDAMYREKMAA
jgi:long-chain acyl-CoA synthetase